MTAAGVFFGVLLVAAAPGPGGNGPWLGPGGPSRPRPQAWDACALLSDAEVRAVQGEPVTEKKRSERASGSFLVSQCFYRTPTFVKSVSVAVTVPLPADATRSGPRTYWRRTFHRPAGDPPGGSGRATSETAARNPPPEPKPVAELGDEAFWVGDHRTGALYVLEGDVFIRVSVGGVADEGARIKRARALAESALPRLPVRGTVAPPSSRSWPPAPARSPATP